MSFVKSGVHLKKGFKYKENILEVNRKADFIYQPNTKE
jgi:hypothetical protein